MQIKKVIELLEGGNVFKDAQGQLLTQRIRREDIPATVTWLETVTGLDLTGKEKDEDDVPVRWLGSTGRRSDSGDIDLIVTEINKDQLYQKLADYLKQQGQDPQNWLKKAGELHFRTPIRGQPDTGFVQTDFNFFNTPEHAAWAQFFMSGSSEGYKGMIRNVLLSSLAKQQGVKVGGNGMISRDTNQPIRGGMDPDTVARSLLGSGHTRRDLRSVESIYAVLEKDPRRDDKLADFRDYLQQQGLQEPEIGVLESDVTFLARLRDRILNHGMQALVENQQQLSESNNPRIPYIEDLVFQKGAAGAQEALAIVQDTAKNTEQHATVKWDGSPAVIFGRDERGEFRLTDKGSMGPEGPARSVQGIADVMAQRDARATAQGKTADRVQKLMPMYRELWPYLETATPRNFRGYLKGDMLYSSSDPVRREDDRLVFQPNKHDGIVYRIPQNSELGQRILKSRVGLAIHTAMNNVAGDEQPVTDPSRLLQDVPGLMIAGATVNGLKNLSPNPALVKRINALSSGASAQILNGFFNPAELRDQKITDLPALMERFINSLKGTDYSHATPIEFGKWVQGNSTPQKYRNIIQYLQGTKLPGMQTAFNIWNLIHQLKIDLQQQLDQQQPGQEGWVLATPAGRAKLVSRMAGGFGARKTT